MSQYKRRRLSDTQAVSTEINADQDVKSGGKPSMSSKIISQSEQTKSLFVHSLPSTATSESLTEFFSQSCPLKHATIVLDPKTKTSKGYGFVTFADVKDAKSAIETYHGSVFEGRKIKVEAAASRRRRPDEDGEYRHKKAHAPLLAAESKPVHIGRQSDNQGPPKLIVRNLPWSINQPEQLSALFSGYAEVKHAVVPKKLPGLSPGFGFVILRRRKDGDHAIRSVNGMEVEGRKLAVDWAVEKVVWDALNKEQDGCLQAHMSTDNLTDSASLGEAEEKTCVAVRKITNAAEDKTRKPGQMITDATEDIHESELSDNEVSEVLDHELHEGTDHGKEDLIKQTLFIQNVPFTVTDDILREHFLSFGSLRYARMVLDNMTDRSKGVGFVCFYSQENADACLRGAPQSHLININKTADGISGPPPASRSLLESYTADPTGRYTLAGRVLHISRAVQKGEAERLNAANHLLRQAQEKDKRRLYLLSEGNIPSNSPLYSQLVASEIKWREDNARQRQNLIKSNPSLHLSFTRLSIRNLPPNITSKILKALARSAVVGFAKEVKTGVRQSLSKEEVSRGGHTLKEAAKAQKAKGKGIVKQAKVVFEGREGRKVTETSGAGRSRGYGFIEYTSHRWALMGLRWLNGRGVKEIAEHERGCETTMKEFKDKKKRLIVEFAIENSQVIGRRQEREIKARERSLKQNESGEITDNPGKALSEDQKMAKMRRKVQEVENSQSKPIQPVSKSSHGAKVHTVISGDENKLARRQRIIGKKRMTRKHNKPT